MKLNKYQRGFTLVEGLIIAVTLGAVAVVVFTVFNNQNNKENTVPASLQEQQDEQPIEDVSDFDNVERELGSIDIEELDDSELDGLESELR